nr:MAG TPA: hypothetical protein [Crassvirales sp.]
MNLATFCAVLLIAAICIEFNTFFSIVLLIY